MFFNIITFIISIIILAWLSTHLIKTLTSLAKFLGWREFVVAFFVMAIAGSLPNLFVDISAALRGLPQLAFGDILGGNLVDLTLIMALAIFMSKKPIPAESKMIQRSVIFTVIIALLPLFLILDRRLDRIDGVILLISFFIYAFWLFSKEERFKKVYTGKKQSPIKGFNNFLTDLVKMIVFLIILLLSSQFIINSAQYFSIKLGIPISLVSLLIVGLGNCFPEAYFSIISAKRGEGWMILGDLMGSVISVSSLVLGLVVVISPFEINDFSPFLIARIFLIVALGLFSIFARSDRKFTKKEGIILVSVYILFLLIEIFKSYSF